MSFQDEVNRSERKKKKKALIFPMSFIKLLHCIYKQKSKSSGGCAILMRTWPGYAPQRVGRGTGALTMGTESMGSPEQLSALSRPTKSLPASVSSSTFSLCASSVTVQLRGPFAWDWCQAAEVALTWLPDVQKSWNNSPLHVGRWT